MRTTSFTLDEISRLRKSYVVFVQMICSTLMSFTSGLKAASWKDPTNDIKDNTSKGNCRVIWLPSAFGEALTPQSSV